MINFISSLYHTSLQPVLQKARDWFSTPTTKKVAVLIGMLFVGYQIYHRYRDSWNIHSTNVPPPASSDAKPQNQLLHEIDKLNNDDESNSDNEEYFSAPEETSEETLFEQLKNEEHFSAPKTEGTPLEQLKNAFPGKELLCTIPDNKGNSLTKSVANIILENFLRIDTATNCEFDTTTGETTLTFPQERIVNIRLDQFITTYSNNFFCKQIIYWLGNPDIKIAKELRGKITKTESETIIELLDERLIFTEVTYSRLLRRTYTISLMQIAISHLPANTTPISVKIKHNMLSRIPTDFSLSPHILTIILSHIPDLHFA